MPENTTSAFSEPEDFAAALRAAGFAVLLVTGRGEFRAQLTQVSLLRLRLLAAEEHLARIAFISVPPDVIRISFPTSGGSMPVRGGIKLQPGEIMAFAPSEEVHLRTGGARRWGAILVPIKELVRYASALTGAPFAIPPAGRCWRPTPGARQRLHSLHAAAIRMAQRRPQALIDHQTAQGLEQELIHAIVECLPVGFTGVSTPTAERGGKTMIRFESLIQRELCHDMRAADICTELGVSERLLRSLCAEHLGMGPMVYYRLQRMSGVRQLLRRAAPEAGSMMEAAERFGFRSLGRFAANYCAAFGESPSMTLKRRLS